MFHCQSTNYSIEFTHIFVICTFLKFFLALCEFPIMHPNTNRPPLLVADIHPNLPLLQRKTISLWGSGNVSQSIPHYTILSTLLCLQVFIAKTSWFGPRPLTSTIPSVLQHPWSSSGPFLPPPLVLLENMSLVIYVGGHAREMILCLKVSKWSSIELEPEFNF